MLLAVCEMTTESLTGLTMLIPAAFSVVNVAAATTALGVCLATAFAASVYARFYMRRDGEPPLVSGCVPFKGWKGESVQHRLTDTPPP